MSNWNGYEICITPAHLKGKIQGDPASGPESNKG